MDSPFIEQMELLNAAAKALERIVAKNDSILDRVESGLNILDKSQDKEKSAKGIEHAKVVLRKVDELRIVLKELNASVRKANAIMKELGVAGIEFDRMISAEEASQWKKKP